MFFRGVLLSIFLLILSTCAYCQDTIAIAIKIPGAAKRVNSIKVVNDAPANPTNAQITGDKASYCEGDVATLSVTVPTDPSYTINWYLNGTLLPADVNLTSIQTTTPGSYTVTGSNAAQGVIKSVGPYNLTFVSPPTLSTFPPEARVCGPVNLNVVHPGNIVYHFRWYTNDVLNGDTTDTFLAMQTGRYRVEASTCSDSWISSNTIQLDIVLLPTPVVTADKQAYCLGDNANLSVNVPADPSYTVNWYQDGTLLPQFNNQTAVSTTLAGVFTVSIVNNLPDFDGSYCTVTSPVQNVTYSVPPTLSITQSMQNGLCTGQSVMLTANHNYGSVKWSTGETTDQIIVNASGNYTATVNGAPCTVNNSVSLTFFPAPVLNVNDTTLCSYKNQSVVLTAPTGFTQYSWNGVTGNSNYTVNAPGIVTLVVTDANGCQATRQINVTESCQEIEIPNTFTPNGDGVNDTWNIAGIKGDPSVLVKIFNRWGAQIFERQGYGTPWDGEYRGKKLPAGAYYYVITFNNSTKVFGGWVAILY